jgi:hypothetical protein
LFGVDPVPWTTPGKVYDQWHPDGMPIEEWKKLWKYADGINFGF